MEPTERFAANMKRLRRMHGYSQEGFAYHAGIHRTEVTKLESGDRDPKLTTLVRVADGLDVPLLDLLEGIGRRRRS